MLIVAFRRFSYRRYRLPISSIAATERDGVNRFLLKIDDHAPKDIVLEFFLFYFSFFFIYIYI